MLAGGLVLAPATEAIDRGARITRNGLGPITIGMTVAMVEEANGGRIGELSTAVGDGSCGAAELGRNVHGLFTRGVLTRIYVRTARYRTRKGIHVGDRARDVFRAYGRSVASAPHAYTRGRYLRVTTGNRRIVFETAPTGRIESISTGRIPEVDYIEGCA